MSCFASPNIIKNGLILYLDAGNTKSYPGSGTTWSDLSGNGKTTTLATAPTYSSANGGTFSFNGTSNYCTIGGGQFTAATSSMICFIKSGATQLGWTGLLFNRNPSTYANACGLGWNGSNSLTVTWNGYYGWVSGILPPTGSWVMVGLTMAAGPTATIYMFSSSGVTSASTTTNIGATASATFLQTGEQFSIGSDYYAGGASNRWFNGNMANAMMYNRALTDVEMTQNFHALRGRFGI